MSRLNLSIDFVRRIPYSICAGVRQEDRVTAQTAPEARPSARTSSIAPGHRHAVTSIASSSDALFLPTGDAAQPIERRLINRTSAALALTDTAGRITYVNPAFLSLWDFEDAGQVLGRALSDGLWLDPEDARAAFDSALTNGLWQGHLMARATTGLPRPTRLSFTVLADDVGRSEGVLLTLHEIDAQRTGGNARDGRHAILDDICERQAECERTRTEALMRLTLDTYPGQVACVDKDMRYVYVNNRFAQAVGVPAENVVGRSADDVLDEQGHSQRWQAHRRLLAGESRIDLERRYVDREGRERVNWVQYRCSAGLAGDGGDLYFAFVLDITDLRQVQRRLATVTEDMGVGLWEATYPGGAFHCNDELLATLGCARADLSGDVQQWLTDRIAPADLAPRRSVMRALKSGRTSRAEVQTRVRHQQGHWVWLHEVVRNVPGGAGSGFARLVGLAQDISALKSREAALEELTQHLEARIEQRTQALDDARREAERANAAKSEFLSQMSHELRTPLNAMLGFGQLLEMSQLKAVDAEHLQEVMRAGRHLVHLIDEILDLATVEAGRTPIERASVALRPLVDQCVRLLGPLAQAAGVALEVEDLPRGAAVEGDAARLKQVLLNLLSNGIKYNRPRGRVRISLHHCADDAKRWELRVADSGAGLTGEQIDRLFQPFERLDAARTGIEGTGIGLALARRLTELMDGRLDVQSVPGHGSTFAVRLVRRPARQRGSGPRLRAPLPVRGSCHFARQAVSGPVCGGQRGQSTPDGPAAGRTRRTRTSNGSHRRRGACRRGRVPTAPSVDRHSASRCRRQQAVGRIAQPGFELSGHRRQRQRDARRCVAWARRRIRSLPDQAP